MICRLCLITINVENRVPIFTTFDNDRESQKVKLIAKFFHLEVTRHDSISTTLCRDCWNHIDEFHKFCMFVDEKQNTLRNVFLDVKCDLLLHSDVVNVVNEQNEESLSYMKDELEKISQVQLKFESEEGDIFEETALSNIDKQNTLRNEFLEVHADVGNVANEQNDMKDVLVDDSQVLIKCEPEESNIFEETALSNFDKDVKLPDDNIPLHEMEKGFSKKEKLKKAAKRIKKASRIRTANKIKAATKNKSAANIRTIKKIKLTAKVKKLRSISPSEDKDNNLSESKDQGKDVYELDTDVQNKTHTLEINQEEEPTTTAKKKHKPKYSLKYPELSIEDKYAYISQNMEMKCDLCEESFENFVEVQSHFRFQHKLRGYIKCCDKRHSRPLDLFEHIKWHLDPEFFKCDTCGKLLKNRVTLDMHKLKYHLKKEDLEYNCKYCDKRFARPFMLNSHLKSTHESERPYACQFCDKRFVLRNTLTTHIQSMHENIFPYICDICGKKFKIKLPFEKHKLEHQGIIEPRVKCPNCNFLAKNESTLQIHLYTHNKTDVLCKYCGIVSVSYAAMRKHIWQVHQHSLSYNCTLCERSFKKPRTLREHTATHTGENLYNCPYCIREFRYSGSMYVHIKQKHKQDWLAAKKTIKEQI